VSAPELPAGLKVALEAKLHGRARDEIAARAAQISKTYRNSGNSRLIASEADALAYALVRMPATYAAVIACLNALLGVRADFAPVSLLDVGAGPGTASWAAAETFSSLQDFMLLDINAALQSLALELGREHARLAAMTSRRDAHALDEAEPADLVIASYLIGEVGDAERRTLTERLWAKTRDTLLVVEPGTPAGYERIIALRAQLIAAGAHVAAPCPHDENCPLSAPDWCHFAARVARSRLHRQAKGAEVPWEDEKFSYVAVSRVSALGLGARVIARPRKASGRVTLKLCRPDGSAGDQLFSRRDGAPFKRAWRSDWGASL